MALKAQPKKKKAPTVSKLKAILDGVFSKYIRLSHADKLGNCTCYTCGAVMRWQDIQNGHLFSRTRLATRFDEDNCRPQCYSCNMHRHGNYQEYFPRYIAEMGIDDFLCLENASKHQVKLSTQWYREQIEIYTKKVKELENGRD